MQKTPKPPGWWVLLLALGSGAMLALVLFFPASWAAGFVQSASKEHVWLADARGTVWNGSARLILAPGSDSDQRSASARELPSRIEWVLRPIWLGGQLALSTPCCTEQPLQLRFLLGLGHWTLHLQSSTPSHWPAEVLVGLGTPWNTIEPKGQVQLNVTDFTWENNSGRISSQGKMDIALQGISSALCTIEPMGSYNISIAGEKVPKLELSTSEGALQLQGQGEWVGGRLRFLGQAQASPGNEVQLNNLLNIIGKRNGAVAVMRF